MMWEKWIGQRIFVMLTSGLKYHGIVLDANESFIEIRDRYNKRVVFRTAEIIALRENTEEPDKQEG
jgi:hypothetical protein